MSQVHIHLRPKTEDPQAREWLQAVESLLDKQTDYEVELSGSTLTVRADEEYVQLLTALDHDLSFMAKCAGFDLESL